MNFLSLSHSNSAPLQHPSSLPVWPDPPLALLNDTLRLHWRFESHALTPSGHIPVLCDSYIPRILVTLFLGAPVVLFPPLCFFPHCQFSPFWDLSPETRCGPGEGDPAPLLGPVSGRRSRPPSALLLYALTEVMPPLPFPLFSYFPAPTLSPPHLPTVPLYFSPSLEAPVVPLSTLETFLIAHYMTRMRV